MCQQDSEGNEEDAVISEVQLADRGRSLSSSLPGYDVAALAGLSLSFGGRSCITSFLVLHAGEMVVHEVGLPCRW